MESESPSRCFSQFSTFMILMGRHPAVSEVKKKKNQTRISVEGRKGTQSKHTVIAHLEMRQEGWKGAAASKEEHGTPLLFKNHIY